MVANARRKAHVHPMDMQTTAPAMTSRLVVMMTPDDKKAIEAKARARDLSTSEFVRQATAHDERESPEDEKLLEALADEFVAVVADIRMILRQTNDQLDAHFAEMEAIRAAPPPIIDLDDDQIAALREIFWIAGEVPA